MRASILFAKKGYYHVSVPQKKVTEWVNLLHRSGIPHEIKQTQKENEPIGQFTISARHYHWIIDNFPTAMQEREISPLYGFPRFTAFLKRRIGVPIGFFLGVAIFALLSSFAWEVRVVGAGGYDEEFIVRELAELGIKEGAFMPTLDMDTAASSYLEKSDKMSWMNIYRKGTVLIVNCQPYTPNSPTPPLQNTTAVNLVAKRDAVIEELLLEGGRPVVFKGTVVKKGDLLVSGVYENSIGYYFTEAKGEVKGKVTENIEVFVPFEESVITKEKSRFVGFSLHLFGRDLHLFSGKERQDSEIVSDKRQVYLFDRIRLPFAITVYQRITYATQTIHLSETEAMRLSYERLRGETNLRLADGELVSQKVDGAFTKEGYLLKCELTYIENIAESIEFSVN